MDRNEDNSSDAAKVGNFYNKLMQWIIQKKQLNTKHIGSKHTTQKFQWNNRKIDLTTMFEMGCDSIGAP